MYPGPNPGTPMSSIRLEAIRDGGGSSSIFSQLDREIAAAEKSKPNDPVLAEAKAARMMR